MLRIKIAKENINKQLMYPMENLQLTWKLLQEDLTHEKLLDS